MMNTRESERERTEERETEEKWGQKREDNGKEATGYTTWLTQ
jgi:hypothetical protein